MIFNIIRAIREKKYIVLVFALLQIPFFVFFASGVILGGSAFNDAANSYPLYQEGHYYLCSHGSYKEVSSSIFLYMQIIEVVGIVTFAIGFISAIIVNIKFNGYQKQ